MKTSRRNLILAADVSSLPAGVFDTLAEQIGSWDHELIALEYNRHAADGSLAALLAEARKSILPPAAPDPAGDLMPAERLCTCTGGNPAGCPVHGTAQKPYIRKET